MVHLQLFVAPETDEDGKNKNQGDENDDTDANDDEEDERRGASRTKIFKLAPVLKGIMRSI